MPKEIAGIRIPDTEICRQAELLLEEVSPRTLTSHCYRTYYFAEMFGVEQGIRLDHEVLYVSALLHDFGLTERFDADSRFEVRGADAAREFVKTHGLSDEKAETVWDAIALHTSPEIAERKGPEVALVQLGAACDMMGVGHHRLEPKQVQKLVEAFPREGIEISFLDMILSEVRLRPAVVTNTWMADVGRQILGDIQCPTWNEMVAASPYNR
jgi:hypothetical protein